MYKVFYVEPGSKQETPLGEASNLPGAKALARETVISWFIAMCQKSEQFQHASHDYEAWRPIAENTIHIAWIELDGLVYGEGYNGGSIVAPPQRFIRIEPPKAE